MTCKKKEPGADSGAVNTDCDLDGDYFRPRDFEYVQPLYDLSFLLEVAALAGGTAVPKYRTFSLWRAGYSLDGYGTTIDRWLDGALPDTGLDYVPSARIRQYLDSIRHTGTVPELGSYASERYQRALRLRSVRGLGPSKIATTLYSSLRGQEWLENVATEGALDHDRIAERYSTDYRGPWQTAHIVPPLLRLLKQVESAIGHPVGWHVHGVSDALEPVSRPVSLCAAIPFDQVRGGLQKALKRDRHFRPYPKDGIVGVKHGLGWTLSLVESCGDNRGFLSVEQLAKQLDPLAAPLDPEIRSDLHLHTSWSDGSATIDSMARAVVASGLEFFAVTDHSRSSKVQGGLTPALWLRQANALALATPLCPVVHGIEVDILRDGTLDLPYSILASADLVVASVHTPWTRDARQNTDRLLRAIESGSIDIVAHATSALTGKPGVPDYVRPPADVFWDEIFDACAKWCVAVEFNCFPSRLDLPLPLLRQAIARGCAISLGSDSHARSHLQHLKYGSAVLLRLDAKVVLNRLSRSDLRAWVNRSRAHRRRLSQRQVEIQAELQFEPQVVGSQIRLSARVQPPDSIPDGPRMVGIDLTAGEKPTGLAVLDGRTVATCSLTTDDEIVNFVAAQQPALVSIDSPLGLPGGGDTIDRGAGIVRVAEQDLSSIGIPAYPALIDSMKNLTLRGIRLRRLLENSGVAVIESYPGAAQDVLCLPRKQRGLDLLRDGLRRLGLQGSGLDTRSHDEMDAITAAVVGRYHHCGAFEPMGIPAEAQLIVPKASPLVFEDAPVICLAGKTGAGKSVVARYLSVFYGFAWVKTRDLIRDLLIEDMQRPLERRWYRRETDQAAITELDLRDFGDVILTQLGQEPIRQRLTTRLTSTQTAVVVDSIRALTDVDEATLGRRPVIIWFVDCPEGAIRVRLSRRSKLGEKRLPLSSPVDRASDAIKRHATLNIANDGTLEELRWRIDDAIFSITEILTPAAHTVS